MECLHLLLSGETLSAACLAVVAQLVLSSIHEVPTAKFLLGYTLSNVFLGGYLCQSYLRAETTLATTVFRFLLLNLVFAATLTVLTALRRLFFHPLKNFPGSRWAALTKLYDAKLNADGRLSPTIRELHAQYGDFVRTGPSELCINNVEAIPAVLTRGTFTTRGPFYEMAATIEDENLLTQRDNRIHQKWRRIWDVAFRSESLRDYNPRVEAHVSRLISALQSKKGEQANATEIFFNFAFDVMADLGFGTEFGMQDGTGDPTYVRIMRDYLRTLAVVSSLRNVCDVLRYIPPNSEVRNFRAKGQKMLAHRMAMGRKRKDVFYYLLGKDEVSGSMFTPTELSSNAHLIIVAGSDTTSSVLANSCRELALNPQMQEKLYAEVREQKKIDFSTMASMPYLNAVINETLRLWNPVPSGAQALTGPEGVTIAGVYVPPLTTVRVHHMSIMTDDRYFPRGQEFIPERWTDRPELIKDRRAFIPFSYGPHVCVGKQLALNQLRLVLARIIEEFSIELAASYNEEKYREQWKDYFTVKLGPLPLKFIPRGEGNSGSQSEKNSELLA